MKPSEALEQHGLPDHRAAYIEATQKSGSPSRAKWSHPAVYVAGKSCGWFDLRNMPESKSWPLFERAYKAACRRVIDGEDLSQEIPTALPPESTVQRVTPKAVARQRLADLIASVNGGPQTGGVK